VWLSRYCIQGATATPMIALAGLDASDGLPLTLR
jgi:hypothetical protein